MSNIPYEGYNSFFAGGSLNNIMLQLLNPLGVMSNYIVTIESPIFPAIPPVVEDEPEYTMADFLLWCRPMKEYLEDEESSFYPLFLALSEIAKLRLRWGIVESGPIWKRLLSLYVAHYMELTIQSWKDEANRMSLNGYDKDKDYKYELVLGNTVLEEFKTTSWGRQFWHEYKPYGVYAQGIWGVNL